MIVRLHKLGIFLEMAAGRGMMIAVIVDWAVYAAVYEERIWLVLLLEEVYVI